jgi:GR25 family glycosyltransferase involved in LPS biosynthesis
MDVYYINLDASSQRRQFLEGNFSAHNDRNWSLTRVAAVDADYVRAHPLPGNLRPAEKACFLSHRRAVEQSLLRPGPAMILEDDAMFGPNSLMRIEQAIAASTDGPDLLYTDICIPKLTTMVELYQLRFDLRMQQRDSVVINVKAFNFAGATAYVLSERAKPKLLALIDAVTAYDMPYDLLLRQLAHQDQLNAGVIFPYPTTVSPHSETTSIQPNDAEITNILWNAFRRMVWINADRAETERASRLNQIDPKRIDPAALDMGKLVGTMLSFNAGRW